MSWIFNSQRSKTLRIFCYFENCWIRWWWLNFTSWNPVWSWKTLFLFPVFSNEIFGFQSPYPILEQYRFSPLYYATEINFHHFHLFAKRYKFSNTAVQALKIRKTATISKISWNLSKIVSVLCHNPKVFFSPSHDFQKKMNDYYWHLMIIVLMQPIKNVHLNQ